jgi:hypothetical protein
LKNYPFKITSKEQNLEDKDKALHIGSVRLSLQELEKIKRIAYLQGVTEYTIWADYVPNGDEICDKYQEELEMLLSNEA